MIETIQAILTASFNDELGKWAFVSAFFAFLLIPYTVLTITERATRRKTLLDVAYDGIAILTTLGIIGVAGVRFGIEGLIAVLVGVSQAVGLYIVLFTPIIVIGVVVELVSHTPDTVD